MSELNHQELNERDFQFLAALPESENAEIRDLLPKLAMPEASANVVAQKLDALGYIILALKDAGRPDGLGIVAITDKGTDELWQWTEQRSKQADEDYLKGY